MRARTRTILGLAVMALPTSLVAQGLTVHTVNDVRFYGALGTLMGVAERFGGGSMHDIAGTTYISGHKMRIDQGTNATILDADEGRVTTIDNKNKTYTSMTFAEMADAMEKAARSAKAENAKENAKATQQGKRTDSKDPKGEMNFSYKMSVDKPGDREKIAGYNAERTFVTISIEGEAKPEDGDAQKVGTLVLLIDDWMSKDVPQIKATQEFQRAYMAKAGKTFTPPMESMKAAFNADPRIKTGFEASAKELEKIQGVMLRGTTYVTLVPPGMAFDRKLALGDVSSAQQADAAKADQPEEKKSGGFRGLAGRLKSAAEEASKKAAEASDNNKKNDKADAKQTTIMTVKEETKDISVGPVPSDLFAPPAGYRDVTKRS